MMRTAPVARPCPAGCSAHRATTAPVLRAAPIEARLSLRRQPLRRADFLSRPEESRAAGALRAVEKSVVSSDYDVLDNLEVDLSSFPDCRFFSISAIIRPWRLQFVVKSLSLGGIKGMTITNVLGIGAQTGERERYAGSEFGDSDLVQKTKLDIVTSREQVDFVVRKIVTSAHTGEGGDGKIFIYPVVDAIRIRTGETGASAEKMAGGREDLLSTGSIDEHDY